MYHLRFSTINSMMSEIVPLFVITIFILIFSMVIFRIIQGARQWSKNNNSPVLTVEATVVTKRADFHNYHHDSSRYHTSTTYYVTFEVASGDRLEFKTSDQEYGMLVEGDRGKLTFQGTRYLGFERS